jgi:dynein heavy chain 1
LLLLLLLLFAVDFFVSSHSQGSSQIQYPALHAILGQTIYGGNVDVVYDQRYIDTLLKRLFAAAALGSGFVLVAGREGADAVTFPACATHGEYLAWAHRLAEQVPPTWLGLPHNADTLLLTNEAHATRQKLKKLNYRVGATVRGGDSNPSSPSHAQPIATSNSDTASAVIGSHVLGWCQEWLGLLPTAKDRDSSKGANPLFQYLASQAEIASGLLRQMRGDMEALTTANGNGKKSLELAACIEKGRVCSFIFLYLLM